MKEWAGPTLMLASLAFGFGVGWWTTSEENEKEKETSSHQRMKQKSPSDAVSSAGHHDRNAEEPLDGGDHAPGDQEKLPLMGAGQVDPRRQRSAMLFVLRCSLVASVGGLLLGYDVGVTSGVLPHITEQFGLSDNEAEIFAGMLQLFAAVGALIGGPVADRFGRRRPMMLASVMYVIGATALGMAPNYVILLLGRMFLGLGIGLELMISPVYIAEMAPARIRGFLVSFSEIAINIGILVAFSTATVLSSLEADVGWRILFMGSVPAGAILYLLLVFMPESPRWLVAMDQTQAAREVIRQTSSDDAEEREVFEAIKEAVSGDRTEMGLSWKSFKELLFTRVFAIGMTVAALQQLNGSEAFIMYIPTVLTRIDFSSRHTAIHYTVVVGVVKFFGSLLGGYLVDVLGRRVLSITGFMGMAVCLVCMSAGVHLFQVDHVMFDEDNKQSGAEDMARALIFVGLFGFMAFFATTAGPLCWVILSELFPLQCRSMAMALCTAMNRFASFCIAGTFLSLSGAVTFAGTYAFFAFINATGALFFWKVLPETKGRSLEGIEGDLGVSLSRNNRQVDDADDQHGEFDYEDQRDADRQGLLSRRRPRSHHASTPQ